MNKLAKKYPLLGSSSDPEKLALTVKGAAIYIIPIVIAVAGFSGVSLAEADLTQLVNQIAIIVASITTAIGILRKIYNAVKNRK